MAIPPELEAQILRYYHAEKWRMGTIAHQLHVHHSTVKRVLMSDGVPAAVLVRPPSQLDPYLPFILETLKKFSTLTASRLYQMVRERGYRGAPSHFRHLIAMHRPRPTAEAYLRLLTLPGEQGQIDWGHFGHLEIGRARRPLMAFVAVLSYSRQIFLCFFLDAKMENFLRGHVQAFAAWNGLPRILLYDNLKSAVLERSGDAIRFNPTLLAFAGHYRFEPRPVAVARGNEKGRVENGVGYVKKNFLNGLELADFSAINPAATLWLESVANVRIHSETRQRPVDMFEQEKAHLLPKNPATYDIGCISTGRVSKQFRVAFDANHYSVPVNYVGVIVTLKGYPDRLCIYYADQMIARHDRSYDRHKDIEDPNHPKALIAQRRNANEQRLLLRFLALTPKSNEYHAGLMARRLNWRNHVAKINALAEIYGDAATGRAIEDGLAFDAFSCEYITNLLEARARVLPQASPLQLTRRQDLLELDLAKPDLSLYEVNHDESKTRKK